MQNDIMDLYGLIYFIDENALPDADTFYKRHFRKPGNYGELSESISKYCFRTMRSDVVNNIDATNSYSNRYTYNNIGELLSYTTGRGNQYLYDYNGVGSIVKTTELFVTGMTVRGTIQSGYDRRGNQTSIIDLIMTVMR